MSDLSPARNEEAARELSTLTDEKVSLVATSYGNELVLGFGPTRLADRPLRETRVADWMLYTRTTPWVLDTPRGTVARDGRRLSSTTLRRISDTVLDANVRNAEIRNSAQALTLHFSNEAEFSLMPFAADVRRRHSDVDAWQLHTPDSRVLRASADGQLQLLDSNEELPEPEHEEELVAAETAADRAEVRVIDVHKVDFWRVLRAAVLRLGYQLYEPSLRQATGVDAIVVNPRGQMVAIVHESHLSDDPTLQLTERVGRLLIVTDTPNGDGSRLYTRLRQEGVTVDRLSWPEAGVGEFELRLRDLMEA
jgi:hypothetical protein